ncbi:MAG: LVIVD repeat-containing protein [Gemmatimonadaceae bacterium]
MIPRAFAHTVAVAAALVSLSCRGDGTGPDPLAITPPAAMTVLGRGVVPASSPRITAELYVQGTTAYTTTWGNSAAAASVFYIWDVAGDVPLLVDSVKVDNATTLGDVAVSDDGSLLIVATERAPGSIMVYSLADPRKPVLLTRYSTANTSPGVHTAEVGRVGGKLYAFLSIDPASGSPARIVIVDLSAPAAPREVFTQVLGRPYVHDTFLRDGILFLALWNDGVAIWDVGGGGKGGTITVPVELGRVVTANGEVHNIWWLHDQASGTVKYALIGEEGPSTGSQASGDVHVVDVSDMSAPKEVAYYTVPGAGTHNFSVDEANGILYAAYYNGGVRAIDVRGNLDDCTEAQRSRPSGSSVAFCDLTRMGRELAVGLANGSNSVFIWGVQYTGDAVYASDMLAGLWKLRPFSRP